MSSASAQTLRSRIRNDLIVAKTFVVQVIQLTHNAVWADDVDRLRQWPGDNGHRRGVVRRRAIAKLFSYIEVAPFLTIGSGRPIDPLTGFDANRSGAIPLSSRPFGFGRNSLRTGTQAQLDLRLLKFFKVGEHGKLDFVVESFNLLNQTNVVALNQFYGAESSPLSTFAMGNKAGIPRQLQFSLDFEF